MADAVWVEYTLGMTAEIYDQVNDRVNPIGNPPAGLIFHCAGPSPQGWRIIDVWESRAAFDAFLESLVLPAIADVVGEEAAGHDPLPEITSWPVHNYTVA